MPKPKSGKTPGLDAIKRAMPKSGKTPGLDAIRRAKPKPGKLAERVDVKQLGRNVDLKQVARQIGNFAEQVEARSDDVHTLSGQTKRISRRISED